MPLKAVFKFDLVSSPPWFHGEYVSDSYFNFKIISQLSTILLKIAAMNQLFQMQHIL